MILSESENSNENHRERKYKIETFLKEILIDFALKLNIRLLGRER